MRKVCLQNKKSKRPSLLLLGFVLCISLFLSSCTFSYDHEVLRGSVVRVEIVDVNYLGHLDNDFEIIGELRENEIDEFLLRLSEIEFLHLFGPPIEIEGYCFKLCYGDQAYEIIGWQGVGVYTYDNIATGGRSFSYTAKEEFEALLFAYM